MPSPPETGDKIGDVPGGSRTVDRSAKGRLQAVDALRGATIISMVLFHWCYDLRYLSGIPLPFFQPPLLDIWRATISWTFLFIAGWMCSHSRSPTRRAARYLLVALLVYLSTSLARLDAPIRFGIIFCMGASTLVAGLALRAGLLDGRWWQTMALLVLFVMLLRLPEGTLGVGALALRLPQALYDTPYLSWLGFPGPRFVSGDYYPLLPFGLMYLVGTNVGVMLARHTLPTWVFERSFGLLAPIGRHPLLIYLLHQPLLLVLASQVH